MWEIFFGLDFKVESFNKFGQFNRDNMKSRIEIDHLK